MNHLFQWQNAIPRCKKILLDYEENYLSAPISESKQIMWAFWLKTYRISHI